MKIKLKLNLILLSSFVLSLVSTEAFATEAMIRHKYTSCVACHTSPRGGGLLTGYGKMVSDSLSAMPINDQAAFFSGGKFSQALQVRLANVKTEDSNDFFPMQADYTAAFTHKKATFVATLAKDPNRNKEDVDKIEEFYFRDAKLIYQLEKNMQLTVGRSSQTLGLRLVDHTLYNRKQNRFDITDLTTVAELDFQAKTYSYYVGAFAPSFQEAESEREYGVKGEYRHFFGAQQVGAGLLLGKAEEVNRAVLNLNTKLTYNKNILVMIDGMYTFRDTEQGNNFNQYSAFIRPSYFVKDYWEFFGLGEFIKRDAPFDVNEERLGAGSELHITKNFSLRFDYRRSFMQSRNETMYISQLYFNGW